MLPLSLVGNAHSPALPGARKPPVRLPLRAKTVLSRLLFQRFIGFPGNARQGNPPKDSLESFPDAAVNHRSCIKQI